MPATKTKPNPHSGYTDEMFLKELRGWRTLAEVMQRTGCSDKTARRRLRALLDADKVEWRDDPADPRRAQWRKVKG